MKTKHDSVKLPLSLPMLKAYALIDESHQALTGKEAVITSGQDGTHMRGSLHYEGRAIDLRVWYTDHVGRTAYWATMLAERLGEDYDVLYGNKGHWNHIHLEYDPE